MAALRQRKGLPRAGNERSCSVKATGMCAIAWLALFVFSGGSYCAPPRSVSVRGDGGIHNENYERSQAKDMTILHRWSDEEAVYEDFGFDYSDRNEDNGYAGNENTGHGRARPLPREGKGAGEPDGKADTPDSRDRQKLIGAENARKQSQKPATSNTEGTISHTVKKNDTLYGLSRRYGCSVNDITRLNGLGKNDAIKVGMKLRVPSCGRALTAAKKTVVGKPEPTANIDFRWPLPRVLAVRRDSAEGVKPLGVEITGRPGTVVVSAAPGVVKRIGDMRGYGRYVIISHGERFVSVYSRMGEIRVKEGESIPSGAVIGRIDDGSRSIHFQIGHGGKPVDPLKYLPQRS